MLRITKSKLRKSARKGCGGGDIPFWSNVFGIDKVDHEDKILTSPSTMDSSMEKYPNESVGKGKKYTWSIDDEKP